MKTVFSLGDDKGRWNRLLLAVAASIAVHEIILGIIAFFALFQEPAPPPDTVVAQRITVVVHKPTPAPTPPPTPAPTPEPTPQVTPTPRIALTTKDFNQARPLAAATPAQVEGGAAAPKHELVVAPHLHVVPVRPAPQRVAVAANASVQNGTAAGQANGGTGTGGGPGAGNGGAAGTDSGTGGNGTLPGLDTPLSPCGIVTFNELRSTENENGSVYVRVSLNVQLRNGRVMSDTLGWYFYYPSERANLFAKAHEGERVPMQFPPSGYDLDANQNAATAIALKHTRPNGTTDLPDCPEIAPHQG